MSLPPVAIRFAPSGPHPRAIPPFIILATGIACDVCGSPASSAERPPPQALCVCATCYGLELASKLGRLQRRHSFKGDVFPAGYPYRAATSEETEAFIAANQARASSPMGRGLLAEIETDIRAGRGAVVWLAGRLRSIRVEHDSADGKPEPADIGATDTTVH